MKELTKVAFAIAGPLAFAFVAYHVIEFALGNILFLKSRRDKKWYAENKRKLLARLQSLHKEHLEKSELTVILEVVLKYSTFTEAQNLITLGYLDKVADLLKHPDKDVQEKTVLVINNLLLNEANHLLIIKRCIPPLIRILETSSINVSTIELFTSVLRALTILAALNESHTYITRRAQVLQHILRECDVVHIKLQIFKIFVDVSTNKKICENMYEFDAQLLSCMEPFIMFSLNETFVLRAVSCCANVLESLQRRWRYGNEPNIATPEFISDKFQGQLLKLALNQNEDIRFQARRCITALRTPLSPLSSAAYNLDQLDVLDVLKL